MVKFSHIYPLPLFIQPYKNEWHIKVLIWIKPICKQGTGTNSLNMNGLQQVTVSALFIAICHLFGAIDAHPQSSEVTGFVALTFSPNTAYFSLETFVSPSHHRWSASLKPLPTHFPTESPTWAGTASTACGWWPWRLRGEATAARSSPWSHWPKVQGQLPRACQASAG